jgi:hypothetical protein
MYFSARKIDQEILIFVGQYSVVPAAEQLSIAHLRTAFLDWSLLYGNVVQQRSMLESDDELNRFSHSDGGDGRVDNTDTFVCTSARQLAG